MRRCDWRSRQPRWWESGWVALALILGTVGGVGGGCTPAWGHETDQFTLPAGRRMADLGRGLNRWFYDAIASGVAKTNTRIREAVSRGASQGDLAQLEAPVTVVKAVNQQLPSAYDVIEGFNHETLDGSLNRKYPGEVVGYKKEFGNIYQFVHFPLDPRQIFRIWLAGTIKVDGVYMGTDKLGHFTDMGMRYYLAYVKARERGEDRSRAMRSAIASGQHGLIFSEAGFLGYLSAGDYSNADLAADFLGLQFYRNLTEPVRLKGAVRPAMLMKVGRYWQLAPFVQRGTNFFSRFVSDHLDEALNPGLFESDMRGAVRDAVAKRTTNVLWRYEDAHGCRRSARWFNAKAIQLSTYDGVNYGHRGTLEELVTVGNTCYQPPNMQVLGSRNAVGQTPLHWAVMQDDAAMVKHLIAAGADVNARVRSDETYSASWGDTPLHLAARQGQLAIARLLIDAGADVNATNDRGVSPLDLSYGHVTVARLLIDHGAKVDAMDDQGRTALQWAASDDRGARTVALLIDHQADVNHVDARGFTALQLAAKKGNADTVRALLEHGAKVNAIGPMGITAMHLAVERAGREQIVRLLINAGVKVNAADDFGWTPILTAARWGRVRTTSVLLNHGANLRARDDFGNTALHLACRYDHPMAVSLLVMSGANVAVRNQAGDLPLHDAAATGDWTVARLLIDAGASPATRNARGMTSMQVADQAGYPAVGKAMLAAAQQAARGEQAEARR